MRSTASCNEAKVGVSDLNLDEIQEVRNVWQFFCDCQKEMSKDIVNSLLR